MLSGLKLVTNTVFDLLMMYQLTQCSPSKRYCISSFEYLDCPLPDSLDSLLSSVGRNPLFSCSCVFADEGGGMRMNSSARAALMNRLAGTSQPGGAGPQNGAPQSMAMPTQLPPPPAQSGPTMSAPARALMMEQGVLGPACPRPTLCVLLKNMFDPTQ